jgi:Icc-related predicted phosphoesterase
MTHGCPIGLADRTPRGNRGGQSCFRDAFEVVRPRLYLCGHLHLPQLERTTDRWAVLNTGYGLEHHGWLIRWEEGRWEAEPLMEVTA